MDAGGLKNARYLESVAGLNIYLGYGAGRGTSIAPAWVSTSSVVNEQEITQEDQAPPRSTNESVVISSDTRSDAASYAPTLLRLILGIMFMAHGLTKLFVFTPAGTAAFFQSVGFPGFLAGPVIGFEIIGGALLILGVYSRWIAAAAFLQLLAASSVHFGNGWSFTNPNGGWEYPVFLAVTALALALLPDGAFSLKRSTRS